MTQFSIDQATETQLCCVLAFATTGCPRCNRTGEIFCPSAVGHEGHTNDVIVRMLDEFTAAIACPTCEGAGRVYALEGVRREFWPGQVPVDDLSAWLEGLKPWGLQILYDHLRAHWAARLFRSSHPGEWDSYKGATPLEALLRAAAATLERGGVELAWEAR